MPKFLSFTNDDLQLEHKELERNHMASNYSWNHSVDFVENYTQEITIYNNVTAIAKESGGPKDDCYTKGVIFASLSGLSYAFFMLIQKKYLQDISSHILIFYANLLGSVSSWFMAFILEDITFPQSQTNILLFFGHCMSSVFSSTNVCAQKFTSVSLLSASKASFVVFMFAGQWILMKNIFPGHHNWIEILGACVITLGCALVPITALCKIKSCSGNTEESKQLIGDD